MVSAVSVLVWAVAGAATEDVEALAVAALA